MARALADPRDDMIAELRRQNAELIKALAEAAKSPATVWPYWPCPHVYYWSQFPGYFYPNLTAIVTGSAPVGVGSG